MAVSQGAYISIKQIVASWLVARGYTSHVAYRVTKYAADAVREFKLSHMPLVKHKLLTKQPNESWFTLPSDFTDYVSVGIRQGGAWRPIAVSNRLIPFPQSNSDGQYNTQHNDEFNLNGSFTNWVNPVLAQQSASFNPDDFLNQDYLTATPSTPTPSNACGDTTWAYPYANAGWGNGWFWSDHYDSWGENTGRYFGLGDGYRPDVVCFNTEKGLIMTPQCFPCNQLYLVYVGNGAVDTMTYIPIQSQAAIEAYIDWRYNEQKRNVGKGDVMYYKNEYYNQLRIMRARFNQFSTTDFHRILMEYYGQTQRIG